MFLDTWCVSAAVAFVALFVCHGVLASDSPGDNLFKNDNFENWPDDQRVPVGIRHGYGYPTVDEMPSTIERVKRDYGPGFVAKQTWKRSDGVDSIYRQFGFTVGEVKPHTTYQLSFQAMNPSNSPVFVIPWEASLEEETPDVATLMFPGVEVPPHSPWKTYTTSFTTREKTKVRVVSACNATEFPVSALWADWALREVSPGIAGAASSPPSEHLNEFESSAANWIPNGDFGNWPDEQRVPPGFGHGWGYPTIEEIPSTIRRVDREGGAGFAVEQTWRRGDGADSVYRQFGVTVGNVRPDTTYRLAFEAMNLSKSPARIVPWEITSEDESADVAPLMFPGIEIPPKSGWYTYAFRFTTRGKIKLRIVTSCQGSELPATVLWDNWYLAEIEPDQMSFRSMLSRAHVDLTGTPQEIESFKSFRGIEDVATLDDALGKIFDSQAKTLRDEEKAVRILSYVSQVMRVGQGSPDRSGSRILKNGEGLCLDNALTLAVLCQRLGFPARCVSVANIGYGFDTHAMTEVYYGAAWHLFDPTFAAFFYSRPEYDGIGVVYSFAELLEDPAKSANCIQVYAAPLHTGQYMPNAPVRRMPRDFSEGISQEHRYVPEFYRIAFAAGFPVGDSYEENAKSWPIVLDLRRKRDIWHGQLDGQTSDMVQAFDRKKRLWLKDYGAELLGTTEDSTDFHTLVLLVKKPGTVIVTYHFVGIDEHVSLGVIEAKDVLVKSIKSDAHTWTAECLVRSQEGILLVENRQPPSEKQKVCARVDAIHAEYKKTP